MDALSIVRKYFPDVTLIKDGKKKVVIEVTQKDTDSKAVKDHKECAMAVACQRMFDADGVVISISVAYIVKDHIATRYAVPESVAREVVSFDRKGGFMPGTYTLVPTNPANRFGARATRKKSKSSHTGSAGPRAAHRTTNVRTSLLEA